jgi:hypothetical protein
MVCTPISDGLLFLVRPMLMTHIRMLFLKWSTLLSRMGALQNMSTLQEQILIYVSFQKKLVSSKPLH